ncbi:MAG: GDP-mannose 4,6-dehydratase [Clostridia bacterium]|nr:GDP-mannose 4,6-dehydratase [Clostridia bacterium]
MSRALIIGGAGFVGEHLAAHLCACGDTVYVTKLPQETFRLPDVQTCDLDILDAAALRELLRSLAPAHIYHLAAQSSVGLSWEKPALTIDINVKGACNVLQALAENKSTARLLLIGSGEEYGYIRPGESPIGEDGPLRPGNVYAVTKAAQNMLGAVYAKAYGLDVMCTRAFNHIGPGQRPGFVLPDFCKRVAQIEAGLCEPVLHVGNLEAERDFTDVRDVVRAYRLLMEKGAAGETYNVGSGSAIAVQTLLDQVLALAKAQIRVMQDPARMRPADVPRIEADTRKIFAATGWRPEIPLETTVAQCLDAWRADVRQAQK